MRTGAHGELLPTKGFTRLYRERFLWASAWLQHHTGIIVLSSIEEAQLPGQPEGTSGKQWLISVSKRDPSMVGKREVPGLTPPPAIRATATDIATVVDAFDMPAFEEDNHAPGVARMLWCPLDEQYRVDCECKLTEVAVTEADGFTWSMDRKECGGCSLEAATKLLHLRWPTVEVRPCTYHQGSR